MSNQFLYYPVKPFNVIQGFGGNPTYYARFLDPNGVPEKGHMGIDCAAPHATPLYAPCDGDAFYVQDSHGGDGIYIRYPNNTSPEYNVILWHLCSKTDPQYKPLISTDGSITKVQTGELIGYTDNTGFPFESSGDHLHIGTMPCDKTGAALYPANGYGGCIDPSPFFNGKYAKDFKAAEDIALNASLIANEIQTSNASPSQKVAWYGIIIEILRKVASYFK